MTLEGCVGVCCGSSCQVVMLERVHKEYLKLQAKDRATLQRHMLTRSDGGRLNENHFKHEGTLPIGNGKEIGVYAFKAFKVRLYGCRTTLKGKSYFICTEIDSSKKQDQADQAKLKRAAKYMLPFMG